MPTPLTADRLAALPGIAHGFFTRHGGVSQGGYASLNCGLGSKDDPAAVRENRARVTAALSARRACSRRIRSTARQPSSSRQAWAPEDRPRADAHRHGNARPGPRRADGRLRARAVRRRQSQGRGRRARRLARRHRRRAGGHAGRHGTARRQQGCASRRPSARASASPPTRSASISSRSSSRRDPDSAPFFARPDGDLAARPHFDLSGYVVHRLSRAGIIRGANLRPALLPRRSISSAIAGRRPKRDADYGRQISAIVLT